MTREEREIRIDLARSLRPNLPIEAREVLRKFIKAMAAGGIVGKSEMRDLLDLLGLHSGRRRA